MFQSNAGIVALVPWRLRFVRTMRATVGGPAPCWDPPCAEMEVRHAPLCRQVAGLKFTRTRLGMLAALDALALGVVPS